MKLLFTLFSLLLAANAFAADTISCLDQTNTNYTYTLSSTDYEYYQLTVTKTVLEDPNSCKSRWGCDTHEETIYTDRLLFIDVQGAMTFKSKRIYINMEDMDNVGYSFTYKAADGTFKEGFRSLKCQQEE
ncbi:hypothetical protein [Bdellovibrio sp. HCB337]|uniref:hypothetical protein n=1 Tax=Bdellovibrio sp. HCB337 TaxID=3394358 RepID=UPI0039A5002A